MLVSISPNIVREPDFMLLICFLCTTHTADNLWFARLIQEGVSRLEAIDRVLGIIRRLGGRTGQDCTSSSSILTLSDTTQLGIEWLVRQRSEACRRENAVNRIFP